MFRLTGVESVADLHCTCFARDVTDRELFVERFARDG